MGVVIEFTTPINIFKVLKLATKTKTLNNNQKIENI